MFFNLHGSSPVLSWTKFAIFPQDAKDAKAESSFLERFFGVHKRKANTLFLGRGGRMVEWWNFPVLECVELFVDFGNLGIPRYHSLFFFFRFQLRGQGEHLRGCNCISWRSFEGWSVLLCAVSLTHKESVRYVSLSTSLYLNILYIISISLLYHIHGLGCM